MKAIVAGLLLVSALIAGFDGAEYLLPTEARFAQVDEQNPIPSEARVAQIEDGNLLPTEARVAQVEDGNLLPTEARVAQVEDWLPSEARQA